MIVLDILTTMILLALGVGFVCEMCEFIKGQ